MFLIVPQVLEVLLILSLFSVSFRLGDFSPLFYLQVHRFFTPSLHLPVKLSTEFSISSIMVFSSKISICFFFRGSILCFLSFHPFVQCLI